MSGHSRDYLSRPLSIKLTRAGHEPVHMTVPQITPASISRVFSVEPQVVWLRDELFNKAFFPNAENTEFEFSEEVGDTILDLVVEGVNPSSTSGHMNPPSHSIKPNIPVASHSASLQHFQSHNMPGPSGVRPFHMQQGKKTTSVRITKAVLKPLANGKTELIKMEQIFIDLSEETANVNFVNDAIQRRWGKEFVVCTSDGLPIEDSSGTTGLKFWKTPARKLFALAATGKTKKGARVSTVLISDDDEDDDMEDFMEPLSKKAKTKGGQRPAAISDMQIGINRISENLDYIFRMSKDMTLPPGLHRLITDTFTCQICHSIMNPPPIYGKCCKRLIGCQECVDKWYTETEEGINNTCPNCRADRAFTESSQLRGMDEFLKGINEVLHSGKED